jgi:hypothetical protein
MASDTTLAVPGTRTAAPDRTEPVADLLARLTPDDLHPARLTGPHAWHPWGLTARPPTDHRIRLVATGGGPDALERLLDHLQTQLQRPTWPPRPPLEVDRHGSRLGCRDADGRRGVLHLEHRDAELTVVGREVVTRDGWPIVNELAALNDRLGHIDPDRPDRDDLTDLARWVHHKMTTPSPTANLACPLPQLLRTQAAQHPDASTRLATILERGLARADQGALGPLTYLQDQYHQAAARNLRSGLATTGARAR